VQPDGGQDFFLVKQWVDLPPQVYLIWDEDEYSQTRNPQSIFFPSVIHLS